MIDDARPRTSREGAPAGLSLLVIGAGHLILGAVRYRTVFGEMLRDGYLDSVQRPGLGPTAALQRQRAFWFQATGVALLVLGAQTTALERQGLRPPHQTGLALTGLAVAGGAALPVSGFWALLLPAWLIVHRAPGTSG